MIKKYKVDRLSLQWKTIKVSKDGKEDQEREEKHIVFMDQVEEGPMKPKTTIIVRPTPIFQLDDTNVAQYGNLSTIVKVHPLSCVPDIPRVIIIVHPQFAHSVGYSP